MVALPAFIIRRGDVSVSEDERFVIVGGGGDPSVRFERKPAWKRLTLGLISIDVTGAAGIGEEPRESFEMFAASSAKYEGKVGNMMLCSIEENSGVD